MSKNFRKTKRVTLSVVRKSFPTIRRVMHDGKRQWTTDNVRFFSTIQEFLNAPYESVAQGDMVPAERERSQGADILLPDLEPVSGQMTTNLPIDVEGAEISSVLIAHEEGRIATNVSPMTLVPRVKDIPCPNCTYMLVPGGICTHCGYVSEGNPHFGEED